MFFLLALLGLHLFGGSTVAIVLVGMASFMVCVTILLGVGLMTYRATGNRWLVAVPHALAVVVLLAGLAVT
jgi:hypothetical protein